MTIVLNDDGLTSLTVRYVERKKDGSFQYRRRVPEALRHKYAGRSFFVKSLKRDVSVLCQLAYEITNHLNKQWSDCLGIESQELSLNDTSIARKNSDEADIKFFHVPVPATSIVICLSEALTLYLKHHPRGGVTSFREDCDRVVRSAIALLNDKPLDIYSRLDAEKLRDSWLKQGATRTARRKLITIVAVFNKARKEKQLQFPNPFEGLGIVGEGEDGTKRVPFDTRELGIISTACRNLNDDIRHIIALQLDTGSRVAEIVGLRVEDVVLGHAHPHVRIRPWGKVRTLKTAASERDIPLVGNALWAAERALETRRKAAGKDSWLFPRYASDKEIKATHASATLNKWLRSLDGVSRDKTTHCFRHAMRDRLRAAEVPHDIQEAIGGWGTRTIGQGYGRGYPLNVLTSHMQKIVLVTPK